MTSRSRTIPSPGLISEADFVSSLWFFWTGTTPAPATHRLLQACLVACLDHGVDPPSAQAAQKAAGQGEPLAASVAAGIAQLGPRHGNAATPAAEWIIQARASGQSAAQVVDTFLDRGERIPGIGHRLYEVDPRTEVLFAMAREVVTDTSALDLLTEVSRVLSDRKQKPMPVNVDGALGAIIVALGVDPRLADALFIVARTGGLVARSWEAVG